jgi:hypothetical protein
MAVYTEDIPHSPGPVRHPGAYTPGVTEADRSAEYGGPATRTGVVAFTPQHAPGNAGEAGHDVAAPDLPSIVGPAPAIGEARI